MRLVWSHLGGLVCVALITCSAGAADVSDDASSATYRAGLQAYRAGQLEEGYRLLRDALQRDSNNARLRDDFIVVAANAGHGADALNAAAGLNRVALPTYVLEALGRAARDQHQPDLAIGYYDTILAASQDIGASVGRDLALIDRGNAQQALKDLSALNQRYPNREDVLEALGLADEALGQDVDALAAAEALLVVDPHHVSALQLRYRMLVRLGAPQLALADTPAALISTDEHDTGIRDRLAFDFRWARDEPTNDMTRARDLDAVIARMALAIQASAQDRTVQDGLRGDLVEALAERGRSAEAVTEYQRMVSDGIAIEPYVLGAAASAYVGIKQPERAVTLFQSLPPGSQPSYGARASYFYALLESGHYDQAVQWSDQILAMEPMYDYANFPQLRTPNTNYARALVLAGLARTYTDRLKDGQKMIQEVLNRAPADQDAQLALAMTDELRGWPRQAAAEASGVRLEDPDSTAPLPQLFADQMDMNDWRGAAATLGQMQATIPGDQADLLRAERDWQTHQMPELLIDGRFGQSHGGRDGVIDSEVDEYVYSSPIDWDFRAYLHLNQAEGDPVQGKTYRHAVGAGLQYQTTDWLASAELMEIDRSGVHPLLSAEYTLDDFWKFGGTYAARTLDLPIAATVVGVHADELALNATYRVSELQSFGGVVSADQFSDGNQRRALDLFWQQRWVTGPIYQFDTRVDLGTSANTRLNTNYFNPLSDYSAAVTFENQWLQYRHYDESLSHEIDFALGSYWQQDYGDGLVASIGYKLVYQFNDRLTVKAGISRGIRPFDGVSERLDEVTIYLDGRF